jgi:hypothetical protein
MFAEFCGGSLEFAAQESVARIDAYSSTCLSHGNEDPKHVGCVAE